MNKYLVVILIALGLVSCNAKNEHYYLTHPKELQSALKTCPNQQPKGLNCEQIEQLGGRINNLAYQLQSNPQGFGTKILALQQTIANQTKELKNSNANQDLKTTLKQNQRDLADCMAVVKWLESPEG
jgi:hypothetical protein